MKFGTQIDSYTDYDGTIYFKFEDILSSFNPNLVPKIFSLCQIIYFFRCIK